MILYIIYFLLSPLLWVLTMVISLFHEKIQIRRNHYHSLLNKSIEKIKATNKRVLLFHAASNGELEQIKPIFRIIDRERYFIFLTISSPSSFDHISENDVDTYCYQAFDFPWTVNKFFKIVRPDKYIITRHDIWPHHIVISKLYCKNLFLINANLPKFSKRSFPIVITLYKYIFRKFDCIYTVSKLMGNKLEKIGEKRGKEEGRGGEDEEVVFFDSVRNRIAIRCEEIDDQVLIKSDGYPMVASLY